MKRRERLNPFANPRKMQGLTPTNHCGNYGDIVWVRRIVSAEELVDLQALGGKALEVTETGVTWTELMDGHVNVHRLL